MNILTKDMALDFLKKSLLEKANMKLLMPWLTKEKSFGYPKNRMGKK